MYDSTQYEKLECIVMEILNKLRTKGEIMETKQNTGTARQADNSQNNETINRQQSTVNNQKSDQSIKETANNAVGQVKEKASGLLDEQKATLTTGLSNVANSIRQVGENLRDSDDKNKIALTTAQYGESLADKIEGLSGYIEQATLKDITRDAKSFARRQPALFVGGAFLVGVMAARFLKSSSPNQTSKSRSTGK